MDSNEFMSITPRYFEELMKQHRFNVERAERGRDFMLSQMIAMIANTGFRSFEEPRQPAEFLPKWQTETKGSAQPSKRRKRVDIAQQIRGTIESFARFHGIKVIHATANDGIERAGSEAGELAGSDDRPRDEKGFPQGR